MKIDALLLREFSGLNQTDFWSQIGVTQSAGSRYERGRRMPESVLQLLRLVHVDKVNLAEVTREDMELLAYLKAERQTEYTQLRRLALTWSKRAGRTQ